MASPSENQARGEAATVREAKQTVEELARDIELALNECDCEACSTARAALRDLVAQAQLAAEMAEELAAWKMSSGNFARVVSTEALLDRASYLVTRKSQDGVAAGKEARVAELEQQLAGLQVSFEGARLDAETWERLAAGRLARAQALTSFYDAIEAAHQEHLRTGDYVRLGIAAQDALAAHGQQEPA